MADPFARTKRLAKEEVMEVRGKCSLVIVCQKSMFELADLCPGRTNGMKT